MTAHGMVSRRQLLALGVAGAGFSLSGLCPAFSQGLRRTPNQILGPFYPVLKPLDQDADLTTIPGKAGRAAGQVIHLMGRVVNAAGEPVRGARVELWQANTHGRYTHAADTNPAPLDPNFEGYSVHATDSDGRYRFKTIKPGAYPFNPANPTAWRAPHVHFDVTGRTSRVITQMYFPGEPLNDKDFYLQSTRANKEGLIAKVLPPTADVEPESLVVVWDIVLDKG
jgi:protocatechuate 3,4-dioxygenase beta subunit